MVQIYKRKKDRNNQRAVKNSGQAEYAQSANNTQKYQGGIYLDPIPQKPGFEPVIDGQRNDSTIDE